MVDPVSVQSSIISLLKGQSSVTSIVGEEIREDTWMGREFLYPSVRVAIQRIAPMTGNNGTCRNDIGDVSFTVYTFYEGTSSKNCADLTGKVANVLWNKQLAGFVTVVSVQQTEIIMPVQEGERLWRGEVRARTVVK